MYFGQIMAKWNKIFPCLKFTGSHVSGDVRSSYEMVSEYNSLEKRSSKRRLTRKTIFSYLSSFLGEETHFFKNNKHSYNFVDLNFIFARLDVN